MIQRFLPGCAVVALQGSALLAASAAHGVEGAWCSDNETMYIEPQGIGFNEHTICDVDNLPVQLDTNDSWFSPVSCRNVYVTGRSADGDYETQDMPVDGLTQISLRGAADGTLILSTDMQNGETHLLPCN